MTKSGRGMGLNAESCVVLVQQKGSNERSGGGECVVSPVCFATNTKANQDTKYQTWISIHKSIPIFLVQSSVYAEVVFYQ